MIRVQLPQKSSDTPLERRRKMRRKLEEDTCERASKFVAKADKFRRGY